MTSLLGLVRNSENPRGIPKFPPIAFYLQNPVRLEYAIGGNFGIPRGFSEFRTKPSNEVIPSRHLSTLLSSDCVLSSEPGSSRIDMHFTKKAFQKCVEAKTACDARVFGVPH
jgi:hypothetical protein